MYMWLDWKAMFWKGLALERGLFAKFQLMFGGSLNFEALWYRAFNRETVPLPPSPRALIKRPIHRPKGWDFTNSPSIRGNKQQSAIKRRAVYWMSWEWVRKRRFRVDFSNHHS